MPYHTIDSMNWRPKDDAVIPRWVTIKNCAGRTPLPEKKLSAPWAYTYLRNETKRNETKTG